MVQQRKREQRKGREGGIDGRTGQEHRWRYMKLSNVPHAPLTTALLPYIAYLLLFLCLILILRGLCLSFSCHTARSEGGRKERKFALN